MSERPYHVNHSRTTRSAGGIYAVKIDFIPERDGGHLEKIVVYDAHIGAAEALATSIATHLNNIHGDSK